MNVFPFVCLLSAILASSSGVVYKPCELAVAIKNLYSLEDNSQLPLIVCIAGYRNYDTSYKLENTKNNTGYYGIFGLHNDDVNITACAGPPGSFNISVLTDDDIEPDLRCLKQIVLDSPLNLKFYQEMCSPSMVSNIPCPITNYVQADVFDPIDKSLFQKAFEKGGLPTPPSPPPTTTPTPAPCCCGETASNYWAFYITVPAILIVLAFFAFRMAMKRGANQESSGLMNA